MKENPLVHLRNLKEIPDYDKFKNDLDEALRLNIDDVVKFKSHKEL